MILPNEVDVENLRALFAHWDMVLIGIERDILNLFAIEITERQAVA